MTDQTNLNEPQALLHLDFPIVGIGASAGGLAAFEAFFSAMPSDIDPDMAFVWYNIWHRTIKASSRKSYNAILA